MENNNSQQKDITLIAKTNFRNQDVKFGIKSSDRQRHVYVIGKTGMGKTTLLENIVMQDITNGHGVAYIDPHGDTAEKLIKAIPTNRINDVVYFNPADTENPIAFNILEAVDEDKKHLVASGMMGVFKKIWPDVWSARMEYILNNAILALLDYPGSTMMGVNRMMSDKKYRQQVYEKIKDPVVKGFWIDEFEAWDDRFRKEAVAAIQNKVGQFLSSFLIRNIVGQTKSTINMREIMEENKILIVNLSKGRIGEDAMRLLGGMIVTKIQLAAMERVDMPEEERKNFYLTVDEFQNFVTESFANILSEARKYRLNLLVAHQYVSQLVFDGNSTVRDAIFGNVGTIISFRVGAEDAEFLEKEFEPVFMANDIINLPAYNVYLKLMVDGIAGNAFSAIALPPIDLTGTKKNAEKVINVSRERYSKNRQEIENKISRWTGMITKDSIEKKDKRTSVSKQNTYQAKNIQPKKENKPINTQKIIEGFEAACSYCGINTSVSFEPDGVRPIFCKDCLQKLRDKEIIIEKNHKGEYIIIKEPKKSEKNVGMSLGDLKPKEKTVSKILPPKLKNKNEAKEDKIENKKNNILKPGAEVKF
jgi:CxxC-x17-CxxC domain-containing protein